jgi:hypothetical protein
MRRVRGGCAACTLRAAEARAGCGGCRRRPSCRSSSSPPLLRRPPHRPRRGRRRRPPPWRRRAGRRRAGRRRMSHCQPSTRRCDGVAVIVSPCLGVCTHCDPICGHGGSDNPIRAGSLPRRRGADPVTARPPRRARARRALSGGAARAVRAVLDAPLRGGAVPPPRPNVHDRNRSGLTEICLRCAMPTRMVLILIRVAGT